MKRRNVSIAVVLSAALVGTITLLLGVFAAVYYAAEKEQRLGQLRHSVGTSADQQATALALSIWDLDEPHIIAILRSGMQQQEILAIAVSSNGKIYVQGRDANWNVGAVEREPASDGLLVGERPIKHRDELLGTVRVYVTPKFLDEDLAQQRASIVGFILLLDATLVLSLYWLVWHLMLKPLKAVERFAASVQAGQRVDAGPDDIWRFGEIEALSDSIRGMTDMLDSRYHALRASEERLKLATRASHIGIWDWDVLRNEMVWDDKMFSLYGCERATFGGTYDAWCKTLEPEDFQKALDDVAAALRGEREFASEFKIRLPDGSTRVLKGDAMTIRDADGRVCRMVGVNFDVTERKQAEKEILALNTELDQRVRERTAQLQATNVELGRSRDAAESATLAKSEFLANMSHEIRTPMNAIIGMTDLALRGDMSAKQRGYLTKAKTAANSLLIIINDILDFSKIEAGKLDMEVREFVLQQVLERVTAVVGLKAQEKGLELLMNTADDVPPALIGDSLRLEQVLINLCANAVKFTTHGEIVVVTVKSVVVDEDRITLRFSVRDTGIGMSEQQMQGLFRPFNQLDASTTRRHGGTGLGLAICKKLVGLMGGEIGVKSQLGRGSDFHFTATFDLPEQRALASAPAPGLRDLHVLVIDDSANARDIFQGLLRGLGLRPTMASSASGGLAEIERAAALDQPYELVLVDWKMPEMDGFEVVAQLRSTNANPPKIVMVTAYGDDALMRRAVAQGLDGYLTKPVSASALNDVIVGAFHRRTEDAGHVVAERSQVAGAPASLRGRRVLLVEDNELNQIVAAELLGDVAGMVVCVAANGQEAVERVRAEPFDAVLMDVQMPVMDGYQATALIRHDEANRMLPIIAMTANALVRDREKCLAVGMNDYVTKPFEPTELFAVLTKWIEPVQPDDASAPPGLGLDFTVGLQRCLGRVDLYERLLERFLVTQVDDHAELRAALAAGRFERATAIAHALITTAGTIGAQALSDAARALQAGIEAGDTAHLSALFAVTSHCHAEVIADLTAYFAANRAARTSRTDADAGTSPPESRVPRP